LKQQYYTVEFYIVYKLNFNLQPIYVNFMLIYVKIIKIDLKINFFNLC
jgi:hypothetical protein